MPAIIYFFFRVIHLSIYPLILLGCLSSAVSGGAWNLLLEVRATWRGRWQSVAGHVFMHLGQFRDTTAHNHMFLKATKVLILNTGKSTQMHRHRCRGCALDPRGAAAVVPPSTRTHITERVICVMKRSWRFLS